MKKDFIRKGRVIALFFLFIFLARVNSFSFAFNHPELHWKVIQTPHFFIYYHQQEETFAQQVARVAEEIYPSVTSDLGYQPREKTPIIVENYSDNTGGYTSILPAKIVIRARWHPEGTSGNLSWVRQVVAHEFTHIVTFAAIEESLFPLRRLMANLTLPMWFIEGLAQYEAEEWHSLKEMVLRDEVEREEIMSEGSLGAFYFFEGWGRTSGYYQSDSFVRYIFDYYGKDKIAKILAHLRRQPLFQFSTEFALASDELAFYPTSYFLSFNQTLEKILGKDSSLLYSEWREWIREKYKGKEDFYDDSLKEGEPLTYQGRRNQHPVFSPSGDMLAFASNRGYDYAIFDLYLMDINSKEVKRLKRGINPFVSFSPDGKRILYSKTKFYSPKGTFLSDLYLFDIEKNKEERLTYGLRADQASFSPHGGKIVLVKQQGGNSNLYLLDIHSNEVSPLTYDDDGLVQNFSPSFSPDGERIVFVSFRKGKRDIYLLQLKDKTFTCLTLDEADDRCPIFSPQGEKIYFISNGKDGVFNLYSLHPERKEFRQYTEVKGGVFEPAISPDGKKVVLSAYKEGRFSLYLFSLGALPGRLLTVPEKELTFAPSEKDSLTGFISKKEVAYPSFPYRPQFRLDYIFPWFSFAEQRFFFSLEGSASDVLERHNLYFSTLIGQEFQYDIVYLNRSFLPTFWLNLYREKYYSLSRGELHQVELEGQSLGLVYQIDDRQGLGVSYSNQWMDTPFLASSGGLETWQGKANNISTVWEFADLVPVCDPDLSEEGIRVQAGVEYSSRGLGSDLEYTAFSIDGRGYTKFSNGNSLALRILAKRVDNRLSFPKVLLSLGGISDLRGYPTNSQIGENLIFTSLEYRFLWLKMLGGSPFLYIDRLGGALFFDAGCIWGEGVEDRQKEDIELKQDIGAELRLRIIPFGKYSLVLRLGLAWPLDTEERGAKLFFTIGGIF